VKRGAASLLCYVLGSTVACGLAFGAVGFVQGGPLLPQPVEPLTLGFSIEIALYGAFHWLLLAIVTFPVFVLPLVVLVLADRRRQMTSRHGRSIVLILALAALGLLVRTALLERPTLLSSPPVFFTSIVFTLNGLCEWFAFASGLFTAYTWGLMANPRLEPTGMTSPASPIVPAPAAQPPSR
jgi:hypothetical protein